MSRDPNIWDAETKRAVDELAGRHGDREPAVQKIRDQLAELMDRTQDLLAAAAEAHLDTDPIMAIADAIVDTQESYR